MQIVFWKMRFDPHKMSLHEIRFTPCQIEFNPREMHFAKVKSHHP